MYLSVLWQTEKTSSPTYAGKCTLISKLYDMMADNIQNIRSLFFGSIINLSFFGSVINYS